MLLPFVPAVAKQREREGDLLAYLRGVREELVFFRGRVIDAIANRFYWRGGLPRERGDELNKISRERKLGTAHSRAVHAYNEMYRVQMIAESRVQNDSNPGPVHDSDRLEDVVTAAEAAIGALEDAIKARGGTV
jgi:hypothetical protein